MPTCIYLWWPSPLHWLPPWKWCFASVYRGQPFVQSWGRLFCSYEDGHGTTGRLHHSRAIARKGSQVVWPTTWVLAEPLSTPIKRSKRLARTVKYATYAVFVLLSFAGTTAGAPGPYWRTTHDKERTKVAKTSKLAKSIVSQQEQGRNMLELE